MNRLILPFDLVFALPFLDFICQILPHGWLENTWNIFICSLVLLLSLTFDTIQMLLVLNKSCDSWWHLEHHDCSYWEIEIHAVLHCWYHVLNGKTFPWISLDYLFLRSRVFQQWSFTCMYLAIRTDACIWNLPLLRKIYVVYEKVLWNEKCISSHCQWIEVFVLNPCICCWIHESFRIWSILYFDRILLLLNFFQFDLGYRHGLGFAQNKRERKVWPLR